MVPISIRKILFNPISFKFTKSISNFSKAKVPKNLLEELDSIQDEED